MPKVVYACPSLTDSVTRPVVLDVIRQVLKWTGLPENLTIQFPGEHGRVYQNGSTIDNQSTFNKFGTESKLHIEVSENHLENEVLASAVFHEDNPHVFIDGDTKVYLRPVYAQVETDVNITFRSTDKQAAARWRNEMRTRISMMRTERVHDAAYSYLIPLECMRILQEIHAMRETVAPYGQTLDEYLLQYFDPKARILSNLIGNNKTWGVAETQARIVGFFDFSAEPEEGQKQSDSAAWDITVTYKIRYDKPVGVVMYYPLVVHNQMIHELFRPMEADYKVEDNKLNYSISSGSFAALEKSRNTENRGVAGVAIPEYDDFMPARDSVPLGTTRLFTALTSVDPENPLELLSLRDLGDFTLDEDVLRFLSQEYPWMTRLGQSPLLVSVYRNELLMHSGAYEVTSDLKVCLKTEPSLRDTFRVRLAVYDRMRLLPDATKLRMRDHCMATIKLLAALDERMEPLITAGVCLPGDHLAKPDLDYVLDHIDKKHDPSQFGGPINFYTVMTSSVQANKRAQ